jgi:hypothetical protein
MVSSESTTPGVKKKRKPVERKHICKDSGCARSFRHPNELQQHVDFEHAPYKFNNVCDHIINKKTGHTCGFKCETAFGLKDHKKHMHTAINDPVRIQFKCKACNQGFINAGNRDQHYFYKCARKDDPERLAYLAQRRAYENARYANDENYRLGQLARRSSSRLLAATGLEKNSSSSKDLGCTRAEYLVHLNYNDRGLVYGQKGVVVDHIRPVNSFKNLRCRVAFWECTNFQNMQLLTKEDNDRKSDSFTAEERDVYYKSAAGIKILALRDVWRAEGVCDCELCVCE